MAGVRMVRLSIAFVTIATIVAAACGAPDRPPASGQRVSPAGEASPSSGPKRLVASVQAEPQAFNDRVVRATSSGPPRGGPELVWLLHSGLTAVDDRGALQGMLAEAAPTLDNG